MVALARARAVSAASTPGDVALPSGTQTSAPRPEAYVAAAACGEQVAASRRRARRPDRARATRRRRGGAGRPRRGSWSRQAASAAAASYVGGAGAGGLGLLLGGGVPGRDGEPQHVGAGAGVPRGDVAGERGDLGAQHRLGADHPPQRREPARCARWSRRASTTKPSTSWPAKRTLTRHPGPRVVGHRRRDGVVEGPVEVGQRHVDQHPRDRVDGGRLGGRGLLRPAPGRCAPAPADLRADAARAARAAPRRGPSWRNVYQRPPTGRTGRRVRDCGGHAGPSRVPGRPGRPAAAQTPAAALSASARSVRSQVNSGSSRPKWP